MLPELEGDDDSDTIFVVEYVTSLVCEGLILGLFVFDTVLLAEGVPIIDSVCWGLLVADRLGLFVLDILLQAEYVSTLDSDC